MKKSLLLVFCLLICATVFSNPKHEFRATWFTTHYAIDWPKTKATSSSNITKQKQEMTAIFDKMKAGNMNVVCMQVRSLCDATYKSSYEAWASILTGTRGKDPGYDPLAFAIEEAHKRGMELHVWVNPFRVTSSGSISTSDKIWKNAGEWIIKYNNGSFEGQIIDPGYPEARKYVIKVLMEIVNNYNVDGILMDDYFYPYGGTTTEDAKSKALYKPANVVDVNKDGDTDDDWRRANVDSCMKMLYDSIQIVKPWVRFGMGTFGIWTTQKKVATAYGVSLPSGITGLDDYDVQACNPVEWIKNGYVDYVNPQLYWPTTSSGQDYDVLCKWWAKDICEHFSKLLPDNKKVHFFSSQATYRVDEGAFTVSEIKKQIDANRANLSSGYTGSVFYNTKAYLNMYTDLAKTHFMYKTLPPPVDWKVKDSLAAPNNLTLSGTTLTWSHPTAERFTVYAYPKGTGVKTATANPIYLQGVVYGNTFNTSGLGSLSNTTIAVYAYDRYGVEHGVALYNADPDATDPENPVNPNDSIVPEPTRDITWVLNGGELPVVEIPTNEQLWDMFKADFDEFYAAIIPNYQVQEYPIHAVLELTWPKWSDDCFATEFMTQHPNWLWLAEYMQSICGTISDVKVWRYNLYAFFNATDKVRYQSGTIVNVSCADFTEAGKPEAWGPAYQAAKGMITLPERVTTQYTLPTNITHPDGYPFLGWWDNATFTGEQLYVIPAYWKGTLYANWEGYNPPTHIEAVLDINQPMEIYDIMGRRITSSIEYLSGTVFIVKQGNNIFKLIK